MRIIFFATLAACIVPAIVSAQQRDSNPVCLKDVPAGVILNICDHEQGMVSLAQPRLRLRLYHDGRGEYEENTTENVLIKRTFRVKAEDIREIERLSGTEGVQKALEQYPGYGIGYDSWIETTVDIYGGTGQKRIILTNFVTAARENRQHYPASLISLMEKVDEIWNSANGIVPEPALLFGQAYSVSYCGSIIRPLRHVGG